MSILKGLILAGLMAANIVWAADDKPFKLKDGDKVVFYGDSITDQRQYSVIVETFVATRYPHLDVSFVNSGWGGDSVSGGGGGTIDTRLKRDVFAYRPTVVTIMLGMNDGGYKAETEANDQKFFDGYKHIVESIRTNLPQARIMAIEPSPYDDVTRPPAFPVASDVQYNEVMRSFGKWIAEYAQQPGVDVTDFNAVMVKTLLQARELDPENAKQIISDHIHPSFGGHMILAETLLKAWGARPVVSAVIIAASHAAPKVESAQFAAVSGLSKSGAISWTELDDALPLPFKQWVEMWGGGISVDLAIRSSDLTAALNQQILKVKGLRSGSYSLKIDGASVGAFNNDQLAAGVNLAVLKTPATDQAMKVYQLANSHEEVHYDELRNMEIPLADYALPEAKAAKDSLIQLDQAVAKEMLQTAQPVPHKFELVPVPAE